MLKEEAEWIINEVQDLKKAGCDLYPMANIGSSDESHYSFQPWIKDLIEELQAGGLLKNIDIKASESVDLVGDLLDDNFIDRLKTEGFKCLLCANILTNIKDKEKFADSMQRMVPKGTYIIVSVSNRYPYVADPVDTLYRPTPEELITLFPETEVVAMELVSSESFIRFLRRDKKAMLVTIARLFVPFYKFKTWYQLVRYLPLFGKPVRASCAVLKKK